MPFDNDLNSSNIDKTRDFKWNSSETYNLTKLKKKFDVLTHRNVATKDMNPKISGTLELQE